MGIGPSPVQKFLGLDWTGLGRTRSGLVNCWTGGIIDSEAARPADLYEAGPGDRPGSLGTLTKEEKARRRYDHTLRCGGWGKSWRSY